MLTGQADSREDQTCVHSRTEVQKPGASDRASWRGPRGWTRRRKSSREEYFVTSRVLSHLDACVTQALTPIASTRLAGDRRRPCMSFKLVVGESSQCSRRYTSRSSRAVFLQVWTRSAPSRVPLTSRERRKALSIPVQYVLEYAPPSPLYSPFSPSPRREIYAAACRLRPGDCELTRSAGPRCEVRSRIRRSFENIHRLRRMTQRRTAVCEDADLGIHASVPGMYLQGTWGRDVFKPGYYGSP